MNNADSIPDIIASIGIIKDLLVNSIFLECKYQLILGNRLSSLLDPRYGNLSPLKLSICHLFPLKKNGNIVF